MRIFRSLFAALMLCGAAQAITVVQHPGTTKAAGGPNTVTLSAVTAGNSVIAIFSMLSTDSLPGVSCNGSGPCLGTNSIGTELLTKDAESSVSGIKVQIWHLHNVAGGETRLAWDTNFETRTNVEVYEVSGLTNAAPESTNTNTGTASAIVTTNSITPTSLNNFIIAIGGWTANDYSSGPTNSFSRGNPEGGSAAFQEGAYLTQSIATSQSTGWSLTTGINWAAAIAAFGAPASGPSPSQRSAGFFMNPDELK